MIRMQNIGCLGILSVLLVACGGGDESAIYGNTTSPADRYSGGANPRADLYQDSVSVADQYRNGTSGGSTGGEDAGGSGTGNSPNGNLQYLDCTTLDPDKIYLKGSFQPPGKAPLEAVIDIEDPEKFCVGLPAAKSYHIAEDRSLYYNKTVTNFEAPNRVFRFVPEFLSISSSNVWDYPSSPSDNDVQVAAIRNDALAMTTSLGDPTVYYIDFFDEALYSSTSEQLLADVDYAFEVYGVLPDQSLLLSPGPVLRILDSSRNLIEISYPLDGEWFLMGKPRLNESGDEMWLLARKDGEEHRFSLDLGNLTLTDDGAYADVPADIEEYNDDFGSEVLDRNGNLIQLAFVNNHGPVGDPYFVVRRFLQSENRASEILRDDTEGAIPSDLYWFHAPVPYVFTTASGALITGY